MLNRRITSLAFTCSLRKIGMRLQNLRVMQMIVKITVYLGCCPEQVSQPNASHFRLRKREQRVIVVSLF